MGCMFIAKSAIFLGLHSVGMILFFLRCIVIALFAIDTGQSYLCSQISHLLIKYIWQHKKRTNVLQCSDGTTMALYCQ